MIKRTVLSIALVVIIGFVEAGPYGSYGGGGTGASASASLTASASSFPERASEYHGGVDESGGFSLHRVKKDANSIGLFGIDLLNAFGIAPGGPLVDKDVESFGKGLLNGLGIGSGVLLGGDSPGTVLKGAIGSNGRSGGTNSGCDGGGGGELK